MKKHAFIVLTTIIIFSTTCMEQEKSRKLEKQTSSHFMVSFHDARLCSSTTITPNIQETDEEIDLIPLYKPISATQYLDCRTGKEKTVPHQEKKPLLHTNNSTQNNNSYLKERLYNAACDLIDHLTPISTTISDTITHNKKVITVIELMNQAKKNGLTEDFMGELAYKKSCNNGLNKNVPLVFACLKKYMLTIHDSKEKFPFSTDDFYNNNNLTETLNVTCKKSITEEQINTLPSYPAYDDLINNIKKIIELNLTDYISNIYSSTKILSHGYQKYDHITNLNEFYDALVLSLSSIHDYADIYNSLSLVEHIKKLTKIKREKVLGSAILTLEPQETLKEKIWRSPKTEYPLDKKNRIALFCILVEKYNKARGKKIISNSVQTGIWVLQKGYGIALPDSFNTNVLDENNYALNEFNQLVKDTRNLKKTNSSDVQDLVDQYYIFNEKEQS